MMRWPAGIMARAARMARGLWPGRNPFRRPLDRTESLVMAGLAIAFLAVAPLAAAVAADAVHGNGTRTAQAQRAEWHQVPAMLLSTTVVPGDGYQPSVVAMWTAPNGALRTDMVPAPPVPRVGAKVMVWVDAAGWQTGQPLQPSQIQNQMVLAAMFAPIMLGLILLCAGELAHHLFQRQRLAAWDVEWRAVEPQWSRRP
jgi:predicted membrane protein